MISFSVQKKKMRSWFLFVVLCLGIFVVLLSKYYSFWSAWEFPRISGRITTPLPEKSWRDSLEEKLKEKGLAVESMEFRHSELVASVSGTTAIFNLKGEINEQILSLQLILSRTKIEGKVPKLIDLRFNKPVISY